ncbi:penicillin acylase family protein [Pseudomonas sp. WN033]|nr:penicillin acylase family protein [Pseudomonas sp. WN033]
MVIKGRQSIKIKLLAALSLLAIVLIAGWNWVQHSAEARRSGQLNLTGLKAPVNVFYDAWGVPHIDASNDLDAYRTLGYLHAQDRLFQMDMLRRIGAGRLSELFGQDSFNTDRFFRTLGISRYARQYAERLQEQSDKPHVQLIKAYQDGINQYIDQGGRPVEYRLLMTRPDYFSTADIAHIMGYMAYSFAEAFKTDALVDHVRGTLGPRHMQDLVPGWPDNLPPRVHPAQQAETSLLTPLLDQLAEVERTVPAGLFMGSNAWAVSAERSRNGAPLLANDPHIGFSVPAVWYEAHIRTPEHEVYGHFLAGLPFALLGQTRQHAWGLTMLMNDEIDFYRERVNPDNPEQVWAIDRWQRLRVHEEVIKIRGQEDRLVRMRSSRHGPIINDLPGELESLERQPVSLFWTFLDPENDSAEAFYGFAHANNMQEFEAAAALHWSPGLNVVYADVEGNIGMWAIGRLKRWPASSNGFALLNGSSGRDDFLGYQPFSANPRVINPREGYLFSANNPYPNSNPRRILPGYYAPSERAERLAEMLNSDEPFDLARFKAMQLDTQRPQALAMVRDALPLFNEHLLRTDLRAPAERAMAILGEWDGNFQRSSVGATIFQRWQEKLMEALFADELGPRYEFFRNTYMAEKSLNSLYWKPASPWWDNRLQPTLDGRQAAIEHAWARTFESLVEQFGIDPNDWTWDRMISLQHIHPLADKTWFGSRFNTDPVIVDGGRETLNNMAFDLGGSSYRVKAGPSTRRMIDLGDLNGTLGINPLGQSGNPFDRHYDNQAELFNAGRYRTQLFDWLAIQALPDRLEVRPSRRQR